jgi:hypothetical protein
MWPVKENRKGIIGIGLNYPKPPYCREKSDVAALDGRYIHMYTNTSLHENCLQ